LDLDFIPVYGKEKGIPEFSGKRVKRGFYQSSNGRMINADINGSLNILRKCNSNLFDRELVEGCQAIPVLKVNGNQIEILFQKRNSHSRTQKTKNF
jgi:hypothetical protein